MGLEKDVHLSAEQYYNCVMVFCIFDMYSNFFKHALTKAQSPDIWSQCSLQIS